MEHIDNNAKNVKDNKIKSNMPFEKDIEKNIKKRSHWYIENDILSKLYGKSDSPKLN